MHSVRSSLFFVPLLALTAVVVKSQSFSTGTLNVVNAQPAIISLTMPATGVTAYGMSLPPTIGQAGQVLTVGAVAGQMASLTWSDAQFWALGGNTIVTAGTAPAQQFLGTANAQDLVIAANGTERVRVMGVAGPTQGNVGIGTADPQATLDVRGSILLSSTTSAPELRFAEPAVDGGNITTFRATTQASDIHYQLPASAPSADGQVLTSTAAGVMTWSNPIQNISRGIHIPAASSHVQNIGVGFDLLPGAVAVVTISGTPGTTIASTVTGLDYATNTITVETSVPITASDRIHWIIINP